MNSYVVKWSIDIEAASPEEAARQALKIQRDPESTATVFDVHDARGHAFCPRCHTHHRGAFKGGDRCPAGCGAVMGTSFDVIEVDVCNTCGGCHPVGCCAKDGHGG